jgi:hypothetical protein
MSCTHGYYGELAFALLTPNPTRCHPWHDMERESAHRVGRESEKVHVLYRKREREGGWDGWQQLGTVLHTIIGGSSWHACWATPSIMCVLVLVCAPGDGSSDLLYVLAVAQHLLLPLLESVISPVGYSTTPSIICI